jgi:hypothetical protein
MVGATVVRYSFGVGLFHSFLHAGLSRRSRTPLPNVAVDAYGGRTERHEWRMWSKRSAVLDGL